MKLCKKCGVTKLLKDFEVSWTTKDSKENQCKDCRNKRRREIRKGKYRQEDYKLSSEQLQLMYESQNKACAICERPYSIDQLKIDHDHNCCPSTHTCGKCVRGFLCSRCNLLLSIRNINLLDKINRYLSV